MNDINYGFLFKKQNEMDKKERQREIFKIIKQCGEYEGRELLFSKEAARNACLKLMMLNNKSATIEEC